MKTGTQRTLLIGDWLVVVERKKIKNMYIRVLPPDGKVKVTVPDRVTDRMVEEFVKSRREWIMQAQKKIQKQPLNAVKKYVTGEKHLLWGKEYSLEIIYTKDKPQATVQGDTILLEVPSDADVSAREKLLEDLYRRQLKARIPLLLEKCAAIVGKTPSAWGVKNMKTRWGTCNITDKRIWLNLQLAKFEPACLEYVITHELVHLYVRNHDAQFYGYMDRFYPDWREIRKKLKG